MPRFTPPALQDGVATAARRRLGPRDQVRRLPHAASRRERRRCPADPQGARLDRQIPGHRQDRRALPDGIIDGEIVALDHSGAPNFAALQAALSEGRSQDLIYFAFDLLFDRGEDSARFHSPSAKSGSRRFSAKVTTASSVTSIICQARAMRCCNPPAA